MEKIFFTFCRKSFKDSKTVLFFHSSMKTEEVLFYIYIYVYIYLYIYKKLSPKWKHFQELKAFLFRFYILCENFSKIGPIIKKWEAKGVHRPREHNFNKKCHIAICQHLWYDFGQIHHKIHFKYLV